MQGKHFNASQFIWKRRNIGQKCPSLGTYFEIPTVKEDVSSNI